MMIVMHRHDIAIFIVVRVVMVVVNDTFVPIIIHLSDAVAITSIVSDCGISKNTHGRDCNCENPLVHIYNGRTERGNIQCLRN